MKKWIFFTVAIIILTLSLIYIPFLKELAINPFQKEKTSASTVEMVESLNISDFRSATYLYKTIFPFDYIHGEPDWGELLYKKREFLTTKDKENLNFYYECKSIGIDLRKTDYFFVIKAKAYAGFSMEDYIKHAIISINSEEKTIILKNPVSKLLDLEILDSLQNSEFPPVNISPGVWQQLVSMLKPKIEKEIINRGILTSSTDRNKKFIQKLFLSTGWERVEFK